MRIRAVAPVVLGLCLVAALTACSAVSESDEPAPSSTSGGATASTSATASPGTSPTPTASPGGGAKPGSFTVPKSVCDLVDAASLERISGRSGLRLTSVSSACTVTDGFVLVGAVTFVVKDAGGKSAQQELDDTVAASTYGKDKVQDIPGLGSAARYGTSPSIAGLTFASVYTVDLRGTKVGSLSISIDAKDPATAKDPLVALARTALGKV